MKTLTVGLVGYGFSGATFHAPVITTVPELTLDTIVTSHPADATERWPGVKTCDRLEQLLADPAIDLVVITSPNTLHFEQARQALAAGKSVVLEKPFTLTASEAGELDRLARERGLLLSAYHNRRWDGDFLTVKKVLTEGRLGELHTFESYIDRYRPQVRQRWREQDLPGAGLLYDLGPHLLDQALQLFGPPARLWADLRRQRPGAVTDDDFLVVLDYPRLRVMVGAGMLRRERRPRFALSGQGGSLVKYGFDPQEAALIRGERPDSPDWGREDPRWYATLSSGDDPQQPQRQPVATEPGNYREYYRQVAAALRQGTPPPVTAAQARDTIHAIERARDSAASGKVLPWQGVSGAA